MIDTIKFVHINPYLQVICIPEICQLAVGNIFYFANNANYKLTQLCYKFYCVYVHKLKVQTDNYSL